MSTKKKAAPKKSVTMYGVMRLDSKLQGTDMFGRPVKHELAKGMYAMPVFDNKAQAEEYADGRFGIMEFEANPNK